MKLNLRFPGVCRFCDSTFLKVVLTSIFLVTFVGSARADLVDLGLVDIPVLGNPDEEADYLEDEFNLTPDSLIFLAKAPGEDGAVSSTKFVVNGIDDATATVAWNLTGTGYELRYVFLKDGSGDIGHFYHIYGVTPSQYVIGDSSNLPGGVVEIDGEKEISHMSFFGVRGGTTVPDGGTTAILLGAALVGMAMFSRRTNIVKV